jgi:hypothetical protein
MCASRFAEACNGDGQERPSGATRRPEVHHRYERSGPQREGFTAWPEVDEHGVRSWHATPVGRNGNEVDADPTGTHPRL